MIEKPIIFKKEIDIPKGIKIIDAFSVGLKELFFVDNPNLKEGMPISSKPLKLFLSSSKIKPLWVYYPWRNIIVKIPSEEIYYKLRTSRNRNLILEDDQNNYRKIRVGVAGLSVGSAIIHALVISGGPKFIKIADFDKLEITNLNRIKAKLTDIGLNKSEIAAREIWEVDPFSEIEIWGEGIKKDNVEDFIEGIDVFIDEMDSIDIKIAARLICKKRKIPVLMGTDNGDGIILDVERFDIDPKRKIFHGLLGDITTKDIENLSYKNWLKLATKIVGPQYLTQEMQDSIIQIGKTIPAVPQLGTSANIAGSVISYVLRKISSNKEMPSGRYIVNIEEKIDPKYNSKERKKIRLKKTRSFLNSFSN